jgi:hypothetical protein
VKEDPGEHCLRFKASRQPAPEICRLRRLLKDLLRCYGFVAVEIWEVKDDCRLGTVVRKQADAGSHDR